MRIFIIKLLIANDNERTCKTVKEKELITYMGSPIRSLADFSVETLKIRWQWGMFKVLKNFF